MDQCIEYIRKTSFNLWQSPNSNRTGARDTTREYSVARAARIIVMVGPNSVPSSHKIVSSVAAQETRKSDSS